MRDISQTISVPIQGDERGFVGRECPAPECLGYFTIKPGTGLSGNDLPCNCPYCGHIGNQNTFWTQEQIEYARSVALRKLTGQLHSELKKLEFNHPPRGSFGIGISMKVKPGRLPPIRYYQERELETEVICVSCTLNYTIYGVFGYCPDCGIHNSLQILQSNLSIVKKLVALSGSDDQVLRDHHLGNALQSAVAAFDGFGREVCQRNAEKAVSSTAAEKISFQSLAGARNNVQAQFAFDFAARLPSDDWKFAVQCFQKRHLFAHRFGVVDAAYLNATGDPQAVVGRKVAVNPAEIERLVALLETLGRTLVEGI